MLLDDIKTYILELLSKYPNMCMKKSDIIDMCMNTFKTSNKSLISMAICELIAEYKIELYESRFKLTEAYNSRVVE